MTSPLDTAKQRLVQGILNMPERQMAVDVLLTEIQSLRAEVDRLAAETDQMEAEITILRKERDRLVARVKQLEEKLR